MANQDNADEDALLERQLVMTFVQPRLERAERAYTQVITSLWVGNGGATLAVLSFIGAAKRQDFHLSKLLWPLWCFVLALIFMGAGSILSIFFEAGAIRNMERANSVLDFMGNHIQSPSQAVGLTVQDWRTRMAIVAAALFALGCVIGLIEISFLQ